MIQFEKHWLTFYVYISRSHFPLNGRRKTGWKTLAVICWDGVWNQGSMGNWRSVIIKINQRCLSRRMVGDGKGCDICMRLIWHTLFALGKQNAASLVAQVVKNLPAMQETWVRKIPWRRSGCPLLEYFLPGEFHGKEPGRLQSMGLRRVRRNWVPKAFTAPAYSERLRPEFCKW